jgi:hypothetical protein
VVVNLVLFAAVYALFTARFNTRDDTGMMLLAAGKLISLHPSEYLLFTNVLIGHLLKGAYTLAPALPWYAWYLVATLFASHVALLYTALRRSNTVVTLALFVLYMVAYGAYMLVSLQFSMVASMAALAGLALLFAAPIDASEDRSLPSAFQAAMRSGSLWCGAALLVWSWMIRVESCVLIVACVLPVFLVEAVMKRTRTRCLQALPAFAVALLLGAAVYGYNTSRYAHWGTENAIEHNRLIAKFVDFKLASRLTVAQETLDVIRERTGVSIYDYETMMNWFFLDERLYTAANIRVMIEEIETQSGLVANDAAQRARDVDFANKRRNEWMERNWQELKSPTLWAVAMFALCVLALGWNITIARGIQTFVLLAIIAAEVVYIHYLTFLRDAPERVLYPLYACIALVTFVLIEQTDTRETASEAKPVSKPTPLPPMMLARVCGAGLATLYLLWGSVGAVKEYAALSEEIKRDNAKYHTVLTALKPSTSKLYVIWADGFPLKGITPFESLAPLDSMHSVWLSWCQRLPTSKEILAKYGVQDLYRALVERDDVVMLLVANQLMNPSLLYHKHYERFMQAHYLMKVAPRSDVIQWLNPPASATSIDPYRQYLQLQFKRVDSAEVGK